MVVTLSRVVSSSSFFLGKYHVLNEIAVRTSNPMEHTQTVTTQTTEAGLQWKDGFAVSLKNERFDGVHIRAIKVTELL